MGVWSPGPGPTSGDDTFVGGVEADLIDAGAGADMVSGGDGDDILHGGLGDDRVYGEGGDDDLYGDDGADVLDGGDGIDFLYGGAGDDLMINGYGFGGPGDDSYVFSNPTELAGEGIDSFMTYNSTGSLVGMDNVENLFLSTNFFSGEYHYWYVHSIGARGWQGSGFSTTSSRTATGNALNNTIVTSDGDDLVHGGDGDDMLFGERGNDQLYGDAGDDILHGWFGNDLLDGGTGSDTADYSLVQGLPITVDLASSNPQDTHVGFDTFVSIENVNGSVTDVNFLFGDAGSNRLVGGDNNDVLDGRAGDDVLRGRDGGDQLYAGQGTDVLDGGDGFDSLSFTNASGGVVIDLQVADPQSTPDGAKTLISIEGLTGGAYADVLSGDAQNNSLTGGSGNDELHGRDGIDFLDGGLGNDLLDGGAGFDWAFYSEPGAHTVDLSIVGPQNTGAGGIDTLVGIEALTGGAGDDWFAGTEAGDQLTGGNGTNTLLGRGGDDALFGGSGADFLDGGDGTDFVGGGDGDDVIYGGAGPDSISPGLGANLVYGGSGGDLYTIESTADVIIENPNEGFDHVVTWVNFYLFDNIESMAMDPRAGSLFGVGNAIDNTISGNGGDNLIIGWDGADHLLGGAGNDALFGCDDDDDLQGGLGVDYLVGGDGADRLDGGENPDAIYGEDGADTLIGGTGLFTDILVGGAGGDLLYGDSGLGDYDLMDGGADDDIYYVDTPNDLTFEALSGGNDTVIAGISGAGYYLWANVENLTLVGATPFGVGNELDNVLIGSALANWLLGGAGNDTLDGGAGNDVLFGEAGADRFVFHPDGGADVIGDFQVGVDKMNLTGVYTSFAQVQAHMTQNGADTAIDLGQGALVVLNGVAASALTSSDFLFA